MPICVDLWEAAPDKLLGYLLGEITASVNVHQCQSDGFRAVPKCSCTGHSNSMKPTCVCFIPDEMVGMGATGWREVNPSWSRLVASKVYLQEHLTLVAPGGTWGFQVISVTEKSSVNFKRKTWKPPTICNSKG